MAGNNISWADYQGLAGGSGDRSLVTGETSLQNVMELQKALTDGGLAAGHSINAPATAAGEGFPLRVESLDSTLFNTLYAAKDIKFFKALYRAPSTNTIEEFNQITSYAAGVSAFVSEGDLPEIDDSTYVRNYTKIKFMGTTRRVSHVAATIQSAHGDVLAREAVNGTMFLLRQIERSLFNGDEDLVPQQFDGLEKLLTTAWGDTALDDGSISGYESDNVIDLRGEPLTEDHIADMSERLMAEPNYGSPSDLWLPTGQMRDLSKILYPKERYDIPAPNNGYAGIAIQGLVTPFGKIRLNPDIFMPGSPLPGSAVGNATLRPSTPTFSTQPTVAANGTSDTDYFTSDDDGVYYYQAVAVNKYGRSAPVVSNASGAFDVASPHGEINIGLDEGAVAPTYYEIFRTEAGKASATARLIARIPRAGATTPWIDLNRFLPGTTRSYMLTQDPSVMKCLQLLPMTKIPLATVDASVRWMQLIYLALQIQKPFQNGMFINVGNLPTGAFAEDD